MKIRVLGASQDHFCSDGVKAQLERDVCIERLGRVTDPKALIDRSRELIPAVVVMCSKFAENSTSSFIVNYLLEFKQTAIVMISVDQDPFHRVEMINAGVKGYVDFLSKPEELAVAIRSAIQDGHYMDDTVVPLTNTHTQYLKFSEVLGHAELTVREIEVLKIVAMGQSSKFISKKLLIAVSTVEVHRRNIMNKLGLHNVSDLTRYAIHHNLIEY